MNRFRFNNIFIFSALIISVFLPRFVGAVQIHDLRIEHEQDIRQCINYAPLFRWQITDSTDELSLLLQIRRLNDDEDSLIWTSDTIPYPGNHFHYRSLGSLIAGNTYWFSIELFTIDTSREYFKSFYFTMNTPPSVPGVGSGKTLIFEDQALVLPLMPSRDQQVSSSEIMYRVQILSDSLATKIVTDTLVPTQTIINNQINFSLNTTKLKDNSAYYYRAQASDGVEFSHWGSSQKFYINHTNDPPGIFSLISPIHGDTLSKNPKLTWRSSVDPDAEFGADIVSYIVEYTTDPRFNYYVNQVRISAHSTSWFLNNLQNHETYYWRVIAIDTKGAFQQSDQSGSFTLNTGNKVPAIPRILAPLDMQILAPNQYILWQFEDDPDRVDHLSFTVVILDHITKTIIYSEYISDSLLMASRFGLAEDFSVGYNNLAQYQLRRIDLSRLRDGHYYDVQIAINDNWGGSVSTAWDNAGFQFDDNINTPPSAPLSGFSPHMEITKTLRPLFRWNPAIDTDVRDRIKYRVQISRDSTFTNTRFITQDSRYHLTQIRLKTGLVENTTYFWRVRSIDLEDALSPWSRINQFTVNQYNEAPNSAIITVSPNDLTEINESHTFKWRPVFDPDPGDSVRYLLEIDRAGRFDSPIIRHTIKSIIHAADFCKSDTLSYTLSSIPDNERLQDNQLYYWRVIALDKFNINGPTPEISPRFIYNQVNDPPEIVKSGFIPSDEQTVKSRQPFLRWDPASDPDFSDMQFSIYYQIQLSPDALFSEENCSVYQTNPSENRYHLSEPLAENKKYFYRVRAVDSHGAQSAWSTINSFITNEIPEPPAPVSGGFIPKDSIIVTTSEPMITWLPTTDPDPGQYERDLIYDVRYFLTKKPNKYYYSQSEKGVPSVQLIYLKEDEYYGYQVAATDPEGLTSDWSGIQHFGVNANDNPPGNFQLISPRFYEDSVLTDMTFRWQISIDKDLAGTVQYTLYYSTDSTFYSNSYETSIETDDSLYTSYRPAVPLDRETKYFWKVVAIDNEGNQTWGSNSNYNPFIFTTIGYSKYSNGYLPKSFMLQQNYPNPFNQQTNIKYSVSELGPVEVTIYDVLGKRIKSLANGHHQPGVYEVSWDGMDSSGSPVPGGMYICRMNARNFSSHKKVLLMK
ncbi:T9SS type A sorting domain-containing protein [bacterium]|nr:T9SS type A sorting domain-containing protein [bacterium]MBU1633116.1 T9SS type A sorting domain-containing protein [bacterium]MBU1874264.1 T9SS type A sorting domain-containing protein [bacterium]